MAVSKVKPVKVPLMPHELQLLRKLLHAKEIELAKEVVSYSARGMMAPYELNEAWTTAVDLGAKLAEIKEKFDGSL